MKLFKSFLSVSSVAAIFTFSCTVLALDSKQNFQKFDWKNALVYFAFTDRFVNADPKNESYLGRKKDGEILRNYEGGDLAGITQKIEQGYFSDLGVTALWFSPPIEQVHGYWGSGDFKSYGSHGYWPKDFTNIDPSIGTIEDFKVLVDTAHKKGIRIVMDTMMNHVGPPTNIDGEWPKDWVRTGPLCTYTGVKTTTDCTLMDSLPDVRTDSNKPVELPGFLKEKWKKEGRLEQELAELDTFFEKTEFPRAPRFYILKWNLDWVRDYGVDAFRADTTKHVEAYVWKELKPLAVEALKEWKAKNPTKAIDDADFFMTGEVYNYEIHGGRDYAFSETEKVDFFANGFDSLINFSLKRDAAKPYEDIFHAYSNMLHGELKGKTVLNYLTSHDDGEPFDRERADPFRAANVLLLTPGVPQIFYGDETARPLWVKDAPGDSNLRSKMNWKDIEDNTARNGYKTQDVLTHWQKLGSFRAAHPAVGAGVHKQLSESPYVFLRTYVNDTTNLEDQVMVALDVQPEKAVKINVKGIFENGDKVRDAYSGEIKKVRFGKVKFSKGKTLLLLEKI